MDEPVRVFAPKQCLYCRKRVAIPEGKLFCPACAPKIRAMFDFPCKKCGEPAGECECHKNMRVTFLLWYDVPLAKLFCGRLKRDARKRELMFFASKLASLCDGRYDAVTFVPRKPQDKQKNGYDHGRLLAEAVADCLGLPLIETMRCRAVVDQKYLSASQREKAIAGRFSVPDGALRDYRHFLLVDDVCTTGATLKVTSRLLRENGAKTVSKAVLFKTMDNYR